MLKLTRGKNGFVGEREEGVFREGGGRTCLQKPEWELSEKGGKN